MWRKPNEGKPASKPSDMAVPEVSTPPEKSLEPAVSPAFSAPAPLPPPVASPAASIERAPLKASKEASRITAGLKVNGELSGDTDLLIDGEVQGRIRLPGAQVTVGSSGRVQAEIEARDIIIEGTVQGNLKAGESVRLGASGRVTGSVLTPRIGIEDGARLRGKVEMTPAGRKGESSPANSSQTSTELQPMAATSKV